MKKHKRVEGCSPDIEENINEVSENFNENRAIYLYDEIDNKTALKTAKACKEIIKGNHNTLNDSPIYVQINSSGGSLDAAISIIGSLASVNSSVVTDIRGIGFSAAAFIFLAGDFRKISKYGSIMMHSPRFCGGEETETLEQIENQAIFTRIHFNELLQNLCKRGVPKIDTRNCLERCKNTDWFLMPEQAKNLGIAHEIY